MFAAGPAHRQRQARECRATARVGNHACLSAQPRAGSRQREIRNPRWMSSGPIRSAVEAKARTEAAEHVTNLVNGDHGVTDHECHQEKRGDPGGCPFVRQQFWELFPHRWAVRRIPEHKGCREYDDQTEPASDHIAMTGPGSRQCRKWSLSIEDRRRAPGRRGDIAAHGEESSLSEAHRGTSPRFPPDRAAMTLPAEPSQYDQFVEAAEACCRRISEQITGGLLTVRLGVKNLSGGVERCEASRRPTDRRGIPVGLRRDESRLDATLQPDIHSLEEKNGSGPIVGWF